MATSFQIDLKGLPQVQNLLQTYAKAAGGDTELYRRWGIQGLNWIDRNFRQEGALTGTPWAALKPNTIANRRRGSSRILQDTGQLKASYTMQFSDKETVLGTANKVAIYHQKGTRAHTVKAKAGGVLAFKVAGKKETVFAKEVRIPALPARPMLPKQSTTSFVQQLVQTAQNYLKELAQKRA